MKSPVATPKQTVKKTERNLQEEMWKFIAATLNQGLRRLLLHLAYRAPGFSSAAS